MDREALVYVDLQGTPHLVGRLWARMRRPCPPSHDVFPVTQSTAAQRNRPARAPRSSTFSCPAPAGISQFGGDAHRDRGFRANGSRETNPVQLHGASHFLVLSESRW